VRPTEEAGRRRSCEVGRQNVPHVHVRHSQTHRNELDERVDGIDHQCFDTMLGQPLRQVPRGCAEEAGQPVANAPTRHIEAVKPRHRSVEFRDRAYGVFSFAVRHELQAGCTSERFHVGNADECDVMSRDRSFRASAIIGFRCPTAGKLTKPIFMVFSLRRRGVAVGAQLC
jgi:hypothetical protein